MGKNGNLPCTSPSSFYRKLAIKEVKHKSPSLKHVLKSNSDFIPVYIQCRQGKEYLSGESWQTRPQLNDVILTACILGMKKMACGLSPKTHNLSLVKGKTSDKSQKTFCKIPDECSSKLLRSSETRKV